MPIFLVGGYSNGLSWRSARKRGMSYGGWLRARLRRLGIPLVPLLLVWLAVGAVAVAPGANAETVRLASQMALIPTWFLAAYLMVIVVAPPCLMLWERWGWASIVGGIVLAGAADVLSIAADSPILGYPNYLLVWTAFHQVGYAWLDRRLDGVPRRLLLAGIGAVGLLLLVTIGPYPISMITAGTDEISNSNPTRVTMAFLGMLQAGLVLSLEGPLAAALRRPRLWMLTVLVNRRIMTWFLWHLTALVGLSHLLLALGGLGLLPTPLTGVWWATRPLWCAALLLVTGGIVLVLGRFEEPREDDRPHRPHGGRSPRPCASSQVSRWSRRRASWAPTGRTGGGPCCRSSASPSSGCWGRRVPATRHGEAAAAPRKGDSLRQPSAPRGSTLAAGVPSPSPASAIEVRSTRVSPSRAPVRRSGASRMPMPSPLAVGRDLAGPAPRRRGGRLRGVRGDRGPARRRLPRGRPGVRRDRPALTLGLPLVRWGDAALLQPPHGFDDRP